MTIRIANTVIENSPDASATTFMKTVKTKTKTTRTLHANAKNVISDASRNTTQIHKILSTTITKEMNR